MALSNLLIENYVPYVKDNKGIKTNLALTVGGNLVVTGTQVNTGNVTNNGSETTTGISTVTGGIAGALGIPKILKAAIPGLAPKVTWLANVAKKLKLKQGFSYLAPETAYLSFREFLKSRSSNE
mgnify:CR=1 FL=1